MRHAPRLVTWTELLTPQQQLSILLLSWLRVMPLRQAFATDSADQSPWLYYRWLLGNSLAHLEQAQQQHLQQPAAVEEAKVVLGEVSRAAAACSRNLRDVAALVA